MSERPLYPGYRPPKKGANWPMWVVWGVFGLAILAFLFHSVTNSGPADEKTSAKERGERLADTIPSGLNVAELRGGGWYQLRADTPIYEGFAWQGAKQPKRLGTLGADAVMNIRHVKRIGGATWYQVRTYEADTTTPLSPPQGWVDCRDLAGQDLRTIR